VQSVRDPPGSVLTGNSPSPLFSKVTEMQEEVLWFLSVLKEGKHGIAARFLGREQRDVKEIICTGPQGRGTKRRALGG